MGHARASVKGQLRRRAAAAVAAIGCSLLLVVGARAIVGPEHASAGSAVADVRPAAAAASGERTGSRPNVVVFLVDDMRTDELRWMPTVRRLLAREGMTFPRAVAPHPLCCPARAGVLTGQYAQNNGVQHNTGPRGGYQAFRSGSTIATWTHAAGYRTGFVGKHLNQYESDPRRDPGWDVWKPLVASVYAFDRYRFFGEPSRPGYVTDAIDVRTRQAIDRLGGRRPFLLLVNHLAPHGRNIGGVDSDPVPAPRYRTAYAGAHPPSFRDPAFDVAAPAGTPGSQRSRKPVDRQKIRSRFLARIRSLASVDDAVGRTVRLLRERGELDDTYLVFTSDNGYALGEHRRNGKNLLSDEVLSIPLVVRGPGVPRGSRDGRFVTLLDLTATVLDLAGVTPRLPADGRSFADAWTGARTAWRDTTLVQTGEEPHWGTAPGWASRGVLTSRYLYGVDPNRPAVRWLHDHRSDSHELENVAEDPRYAAVRRALASRLRELGRCRGASCDRRFGALPEPLPSSTEPR